MSELHRPRFHFSPQQWMNDPIPFYWDGAYHVFFQHNPAGAYWGDMHWGHAVSRDLVRWEQLPIALAPSDGGPDRDGVFTGCVVERGGLFYALYTGIPRLKPLHQVQCLATSADLLTWRKRPEPVIREQPPGLGACFRDPQVWREGGRWRMVLGSELPERQGGAALLYESDDLADWRYLGVLVTSPAARTGHDFECPDFFPLGAAGTAPAGATGAPEPRHVLLSSRGRTWWQTGAYESDRFTMERWGPVDSETYYAAKTLLDGRGRRVLFGWIRERRSREAQVAAGWSGVLALPRVLTLLPDGTLGQEPAPELAALRRSHHRLGPLHLQAAPGETEAAQPLAGIAGDALEIEVQIRPGRGACGVRVRCTPDAAEYAEVRFDPEAGQLGDVPLPLGSGEPLRLRVFVDRSVVEAFANGRACFTTRTYPERADALGVALFTEGTASVESVQVWGLR